MVKKIKRPVLATMVPVLALGLTLTGCADSKDAVNSTSSPSGSQTTPAATQSNAIKPVTLSLFIDSPYQQPTPDNKIYKMIKDKTGVSLKMEFLVGDLQQKLGVMIAGGDYADIMTGNDKLIAAGAFVPLEDLIDKYAPNLKKHYASVWNQMKDPASGHIYALPNYNVFSGQFNETAYEGPGFYLQKDVLKEMGYPSPKTLDEYFDIIAKYKAKHPDMIGFETLNFDWRNFPLLNPPEHLAGHPNDGGVIVENEKAQIFADKDIAKTYYKKLNEINAQGLMDREALVQNYDQYLAKIASGRVIGMFDQHWNFGDGERSLISQNKIGSTYVGFPLLYPGAKEYYRDRPVLNINRGYGISTKAKDPVQIIKFLDSLMTEDWQKTLQWGIQGEDYMVKDGKFYRTPEQRAKADDNTWKLANKAEAFFANSPKMQGTYSDGNATDPGTQPQEFYDSLKPQDQEVLKAYNHKTWAEFFKTPAENPVYYPAWSIDLIDGSPAKVANTKMTDLAVKYLPRAILAKPDDFEGVWKEYVDQISKSNFKAYEDRINDQINWRIKNWSSK
ncbi:sugar ABC transporter substrate-binding protein [Paenibacillus aceris]|uniref:Aldouronate transport system substrate-binding protein n=1 Tax=Paenibacillus aceris TaxID=869555 RepID=A0ABS4I5D7_9BACL|nr:sugar ABC transporter substrate-binding protein [Paenibacillus aceris]MBP1966137.1 putative aldouronate transport system substrate-binding protein [Paenibacillus aceris]NHW33296.1 sugar ABC transporter substrate-binding protein [Paenibacillus aceris]